MTGSHNDPQLEPTAPRRWRPQGLALDLQAGVVVFLVAMPLCLGIALASGAPLVAGLVSGIVGGIVVGALSGSNTSVSGPAAGMVAVVLAQIASLGSYEAFLLAVVLAGLLQVGLGLARAGFVATLVPTSVIKGLTAAIGVILVLKQIPHLVGHDSDPEGEEDFVQVDHENTFSELMSTVSDLHAGAALVGLLSVVLLVGWKRWGRWKPLENSRVPAPLAVVILGLVLGLVFERLGGIWTITESHLVQVPLASEVGGLVGMLRAPDFSAWDDPRLYTAAITIAVIASLETLLNLQATDRLDPQQRASPPNRELVAQGVGNMVSGLLGGLPVTSVIVRSSVNIYANAATKLSAILHGLLLGGSVVLLPALLNRIPLSCLAAILVTTGARLATPALLRQMVAAGRDQWIPFVATVLGIVFSNMLVGLALGIAVSLAFILGRHSRRSLRRVAEKHLGGDVLRVELPTEVTFLNLTTLQRLLDGVPKGAHVLLDATDTEFVDPDVLAMIREFRDVRAPARGVHLSMNGFHDAYRLRDHIEFVDYSTRELQDRLRPEQVLAILREGNLRFVQGRQLNRDLARQVGATARGQHPLAVVLSCIDSRTPAELVFDMGLGDLFSVRVAGNVLSPKVLGSMEFGCAVAGARLIVVMGHTKCGAVTAAVDLAGGTRSVAEVTGCEHLHHIVDDIQLSVGVDECLRAVALPTPEKSAFVDEVARRNVRSVVQRIVRESSTIRALVAEQKIALVGVLYDVATGAMEFMLDDAIALPAGETEAEPARTAASAR
jgi:MFS superfamily sulfate permease-like transporter